MKKGEHSEISLLSEIVLTMRIIWKLLDLYEFLGNYSVNKNYQTIGNNSVSEGYEFYGNCSANEKSSDHWKLLNQ